MPRRLLAVLLLVGVVACGSTPRASRPRPGPVTRAPAVTEPPAFVTVVPGFGMNFTVPDSGSPDRRVITIGGLRMSEQAGAFAFAEQLLAYPIVAASRVADGFVMLDAAGSVWRASSFEGALSHVGSIGVDDVQSAGQSTGWLGVMARPPADLFVTDGALPARRIDALPGASVMSAAFLDAQRGVAVLDGGQLAMTDDAGASWRGLDHDALGRRVNVIDGRLAVEPAENPFDRERWFVDAAGAVTRGPAPDERLLARLGESTGPMARAHPSMFLNESPVAADGRIVVRPGRRSRELWLVDLRSGEAEAVPDAMPSAECRLESWGAAVALVCGEQGEPAVVHRSLDGRHFERVATLGLGRYESPTLSMDGESVAWIGRGDGVPRADADASEPVLWIARESNAWRAERVPTDSPRAWQHFVLSGEWMSAQFAAGVLRTTTGAPSLPSDPPGETERAHGLTVDGKLWRSTSDEGGQASLWLGPPDGELTRITLPAGARGAAMRDARRGIAVGAHLGHAWRTVDGGATWEPLEVAVRGDATHVAMFPRTGTLASRIECRWSSCIARGTEGISLIVHGWGAIERDTEHALLVGDGVPVDREPQRLPASNAFTGAALSCAYDGTPPAAPAARPPVPPAREGSTSLDVRGGVGVVHVTRRGEGDAATWEIAWEGRDARGAFRGRSRATTVPRPFAAPRVPGVGGDVLEELELVGITRAGAFVSLPAPSTTWWAPRGGAIVEVATDLAGLARAVELDARRAALLATMGDQILLFEAGPTEVTLVSRRYVAPMGRIPGLVREADRTFALASTLPASAATRVYSRTRTTLPRDVPADGEVTVCSAARTPSTVDVWLADGPQSITNFATGLGVASSFRADLEITDGRACIRAVDWFGIRGTSSGRLVAAADGRLAGAMTTASRTARIRCGLQRIEPR